MPDNDEELPELATNEVWRGIMIKARKDHGMTQDDIAARLGISQVMVSKIETGESQSSKHVLPICRILSISKPMHFEDAESAEWQQMGTVLRNKNPHLYDEMRRLGKAAVADALKTEQDLSTGMPKRR